MVCLQNGKHNKWREGMEEKCSLESKHQATGTRERIRYQLAETDFKDEPRNSISHF